MNKIIRSVLYLVRKFFLNFKYNNKFKAHDVHPSFRCDNVNGLVLGEKVYIGPFCHFDALGKIEISDYAIIGPHVKIWSYNHDFNSEIVPYGFDNIMKPVKIGRGVWLGLGVIVLPGTTIGEGSIVGAGAIVKGNIAPYSIVRPTYGISEPITVLKNKDLFQRAIKK